MGPMGPMRPFIQLVHFSASSASAQPSASTPGQALSGTQLPALYGVPATRPALGTTRRASVAIVVAHSYAGMQADLPLYSQSAANFGATVA